MGKVEEGLPVTGYKPHIDELYARECRCRNVRRLLESEMADTALRIGNKEDLVALFHAIQEEDSIKVKRILRRIIHGKDYDGWSFTELRKEAQKLQVYNYSRLTKAELAFKVRKIHMQREADEQREREGKDEG